MTDPQDEGSAGTERRDLGRALAYGVVMATIQMAVLLWLLYC